MFQDGTNKRLNGDLMQLSSGKGAIVLVAYNRPEELRRVISAIRNSQREDINELLIALQLGNAEVEEICRKIDWIKTRIIVSNPNFDSIKKRINYNVFQGIASAFQNSLNEWIVLIEDDILVANDFFRFIATMMNSFASEKRFFGVNGFSGIPSQKVSPSEFGTYRYGFGWGWAINRRIWNYLNNYWNGNEDFHWDGLIEPIVKTGFVVMPLRSRILNIGFNERASHTFKVDGSSDVQESKLQESFMSNFFSGQYVERTQDLNWRRDCRRYLNTKSLVGVIVGFVYNIQSRLRIKPKDKRFVYRIKAKAIGIFEIGLDLLYIQSYSRNR
jgi:hypothetical protein